VLRNDCAFRTRKWLSVASLQDDLWDLNPRTPDNESAALVARPRRITDGGALEGGQLALDRVPVEISGLSSARGPAHPGRCTFARRRGPRVRHLSASRPPCARSRQETARAL